MSWINFEIIDQIEEILTSAFQIEKSNSSRYGQLIEKAE